MLYEWHWTTYILYIFVGLFFLNCLKYLQYDDGKPGSWTAMRNRRKRAVFIFAAYLILLALPMLRDIDIYPAYETAVSEGIRTIDPQGYIWQIMKGDNPGFHLIEMLTFQQTEPLFYTIAQFILKLGGGINMVWFVIFSLVIVCYIYFFRHTMEKGMNYMLLFPFIPLFLYSMSGIRSGLSFAFFYAALANKKRGKTIAAIICLCIGFCFHSLIVFGIVGLIFDAVWKKLTNQKYFAVFGFLFIVAGIVSLKTVLASIIVNTKYWSYLEGPGLTIIGQAPELLVFLLCLINYNKLKEKYPDRTLFMNLVIFNAFCVPFVIIFGAYRINMYFIFPRIYVWEMLIKLYTEKYKIYGQKLTFRIGEKKYGLYDLCGAVIAFLWSTKQLYDMRGMGIMPLFNLYI